MVSTGKLYSDRADFLTGVQYRLLAENLDSVSGELMPQSHGRLDETVDYIVELEDSRQIRCSLHKNVNRPVAGLPPRFVYRFIGS